MKTTINIADSLLAAAKAAAGREGTTLRALVEQGLRAVLATRRPRRSPFRLRDATFTGTGLQRGIRLSDWERIANAAYERRGE